MFLEKSVDQRIYAICANARYPNVFQHTFLSAFHLLSITNLWLKVNTLISSVGMKFILSFGSRLVVWMSLHLVQSYLSFGLYTDTYLLFVIAIPPVHAWVSCLYIEPLNLLHVVECHWCVCEVYTYIAYDGIPSGLALLRLPVRCTGACADEVTYILAPPTI